MDILKQLSENGSSRRKMAAKELRKTILAGSGKTLLNVLKKEVLDKRTWETQYHMIMAIAFQNYSEAYPFLKSLKTFDIEPMTRVALGDALTRFELENETGLDTIIECMPEGKVEIVEGCIRALAMSQTKDLPIKAINEIIHFSSQPKNEQVLFWTCLACSNWTNETTKLFLSNILNKPNLSNEVRKVAQAALKGKYLKFSIL